MRRERTGIARHGRLPETTAGGTLGKLFAMLLTVSLVSAAVLGGIAYLKLRGNVQTFKGDDGAVQTDVPKVTEALGGVNILLVGSDDRTGQGAEFGEGQSDAEGKLNDVNMVLHISQDLTHAEAVSIPRDTLIDTAKCRNEEGESVPQRYGVPINSILNEGGIGCISATIQKLSGLQIHYTAMVKFRGVIEMSNAVGGVQVCVAQAIDDDYVGLHLDRGTHSLQGADALKFLRTRHGVGDGSDLARISNQQVFLSSLIRQVKSGDTLTNPAKVYGIAQAVTRNMTLSQQLNDPNTLVELATSLQRIPTDQITFMQIPTGYSTQVPGKVQPKQPDMDEMWSLIRRDVSMAKARQASASPAPTGSAGASPSASPAAGATGAPGATGSAGATSTPAPTAAPENLQARGADQSSCANPSGG